MKKRKVVVYFHIAFEKNRKKKKTENRDKAPTTATGFTRWAYNIDLPRFVLN